MGRESEIWHRTRRNLGKGSLKSLEKVLSEEERELFAEIIKDGEEKGGYRILLPFSLEEDRPEEERAFVSFTYLMKERSKKILVLEFILASEDFVPKGHENYPILKLGER